MTAVEVDYDMRGYWLNNGATGLLPVYSGGHFPDTWKTPYDTSFSNQSQYAAGYNPATGFSTSCPFQWGGVGGNQLLDVKNGLLIFDETADAAQSDCTTFVEWDQWSVQQEYGRQGSTATFVLTAQPDNSAPHETPLTLVIKPMSVIRFLDTALDEFIYAGIATAPYMVFISPTLIQYWVQCTDFTYYADSAIVNASYNPLPADTIFKDLTNTANCGITPGTVTPGPTISQFQSNYLQLTDAWDQVGNLASWQNDYNWFVDENLEVNWETEQTAPSSGITFTDNVTGNPTTTVGYIDKSQMWRYLWDGTSLRNDCIVQGASKQASTTDTWQGDGVTSQFQLTYDLAASINATLTVGGVSKTISVVTDVAAATTQYCLVQSPVSGVWNLVNGTSGAPAAAATIALTYTYNVPIIQRYTNTTSQAQYQGPNNGLFTVFLSDNTLTTASMALLRAISEVNQYAFVLETFTFTTAAGWPGHIRVGQTCVCSTQYIPDAENDWNVGFSDTFIVIRNNIQGIRGGYRTYEITAVRLHDLV